MSPKHIELLKHRLQQNAECARRTAEKARQGGNHRVALLAETQAEAYEDALHLVGFYADETENIVDKSIASLHDAEKQMQQMAGIIN